MKTKVIMAIPSKKYGTEHASIRMFINGILCAFTFAESPLYFGRPEHGDKYELWGTYSALTAEGDGMKDVFDIKADEVIIISHLGSYRIRPISADDIQKYGVNIWRGLYAHPISGDAVAYYNMHAGPALIYQEQY